MKAIAALLLISLAGLCTAAGAPRSAKLVKHLQSVSDPWILPQTEEAESVNVSVSLILRDFRVVPREGAWELSLWTNFGWTDPFLAWDPSKFGDMAQVEIAAKDIWHPHDITLYSSRKPVEKLHDWEQIVVYASGMATQISARRIHPACNISFTPDGQLATRQSCKLTYGAWVYADKTLQVTLGEKIFDTSYMESNACWSIEETKAEAEKKKYPCCPETYTKLNFFIHLQLKPNAPNYCLRV